jgi:hypothetical protein
MMEAMPIRKNLAPNAVGRWAAQLKSRATFEIRAGLIAGAAADLGVPIFEKKTCLSRTHSR